MSIDKRPNGRWRVRHPGVPSKTFDRKKDAEDYEAQVRRLKQTGRVDTLDSDLITLAELAVEHMNAVAGDLAASTFTNYVNAWAAHVDASVRITDADEAAKAWRHEIASKTLREIRPKTIEAWRDERLKAGAGPQTIRTAMVVMQSMFGRAIRDERVAANPVVPLKKPSGKRVGAVDVITPEGVEQIRSRCDAPAAMFVSVLAYAGMRPGEVRALRWKHVQTKTIRVEWATNGDGTVKQTKTEHRRTVRLVKPLADDLAAWRRTQGMPGDEAFVFPRADGTAWTVDDYNNWRNRSFSKAAKTAGVKIGRPYDLRHSAASLWLHEGTNMVQVAAWLGHSVDTLTKVYAHVLADLSPTKRSKAETVIAQARKKVGRQDTSRTHGVVNGRQPKARPTANNPALMGRKRVAA